MLRDMATRWMVKSRIYYLGQWEGGVAQRVRAEREDGTPWTRVLETIYW